MTILSRWLPRLIPNPAEPPFMHLVVGKASNVHCPGVAFSASPKVKSAAVVVQAAGLEDSGGGFSGSESTLLGSITGGVVKGPSGVTSTAVGLAKTSDS